MKLRKTTATLLIAIFMTSAFAVAIPVMSVESVDYKDAILKAADRIILGQNLDGGFDWNLIVGDSASYTNILGISAIGVLKAYEIDPRAVFKTSMAMAYKYAVDYEPGWTYVDVKWKETTPGVDSFPDITFILELAREAAQDSTLLAEINSKVSGTTVAGIAALAKTRWDDRLNHLGAVAPNEVGTATAMANRIRDERLAQNIDPTWDLEAGVKAALALGEYYSEQGYVDQAIEIAEVINGGMVEGGFFDPEDVLSLAGAIEAFTEVGLYPGKVIELKTLLITAQGDDHWGDAQCTAYAIMALLAQGDVDARASAALGGGWLISVQQDPDGGWLVGSTEYPEIDSEAAWALFNSILKSNFVPGTGKGLDKPIPNDNFARGRQK